MDSCLRLTLNLLLKNVRQRIPTNAAVSPLSLNAIVAMLGAGSSGRTRDRVFTFAESKSVDELKSRFSKSMSIVTSCSEDCPKISFINAAWIDKRAAFMPSYQECLRDTFKCEAKTLDFIDEADGAVRDINSWAESQTNGFSKNVVRRDHQLVTPLTTVILGNALYFRGFWLDKFKTKWTEKRDFYLLNGDKISDVPFMTSSIDYLYGSFDDFKVLEIPYRRGKEAKNKFSMQLILPHKRDGLHNLLEKFNADSGLLSRHFELQYTWLDDFWIPKFKFSYTLEDIKFPFMDEDMDLTEMLQKVEGVSFTSKFIQKTEIEVDEEGTEAAAVTFCGDEAEWMPLEEEREIKTFVADHPFIFVVKENTSGLVLFGGAVLNPLEN